jgi:hypothetical protein
VLRCDSRDVLLNYGEGPSPAAGNVYVVGEFSGTVAFGGWVLASGSAWPMMAGDGFLIKLIP